MNLNITKYDPKTHCGAPEMDKRSGKRLPCTKPKGDGPNGLCKLHQKSEVYYSHIKRNRLSDLLEKVQQNGSDPTDIYSEVMLLRAMLMGYVEDHADFFDPSSLSLASDLIDKVIRASVSLKKLRQEEMIHLKILEHLNVQMAVEVMRAVNAIDPDKSSDWRTALIEEIKGRWGRIEVPTNLAELKRMTAEDGGGVVDYSPDDSEEV